MICPGSRDITLSKESLTMKFLDRKQRGKFDIEVEKLVELRISRREFLKRGSALGVSAAVLMDVLRIPNLAHADETENSAVLEGIRKEGGHLHIYCWDGIFHPDTIPEFEWEFGVKVLYESYSTDAKLLDAVRQPGTAYDCICPTHSFVPTYIEEGLLAPLNFDNIPNFKNLTPHYVNTDFDPGNKFTVAMSWGTMCMMRNMRATRDDSNTGSWRLIFDSGPRRYSGRIGFTNEKKEVISAALSSLGYSVNTHDRRRIREAGGLLMKLKPHIRAFYPGDGQKAAMLSDEIVVASGWNGEVVKASWQSPSIKPFIPAEGVTGWFDNLCVPKAAKHSITAQAFINYLHRPEIAGRNSNATAYATANQKAVDGFIKGRIARNRIIYPTNQDFRRIEFTKRLPEELSPLYNRIWENLLMA